MIFFNKMLYFGQNFNNMAITLYLLLFFCFLLGLAVGWFFAFRQMRSKNYVLRDVYDQLQRQADVLREDLVEKEMELRNLGAELASSEERTRNLQEQLAGHKEELASLHRQNKEAFENLANRLLEEKSRKFALYNKEQLDGLLRPLRERIKEFGESIDKKFAEDARDKHLLKASIEQLQQLNGRLSEEANRLTKALTGDNKTQGDWGEYQLEVLLQKAGLEKDIHYSTQLSFKDENGQLKRPDFLVHLPQGKELVIDCKVSLTAYERYFDVEDKAERSRLLKEHLHSLRQHIKGLSKKNYQKLYDIHTPDYVLLYLPVEGAFTLAQQGDPDLFVKALEDNIVIVSPTTLLATMRTVAYIWKQEKQKKSVEEIVRQSGLLYDRFVAFVEDLKEIGQRLDMAQLAYDSAMRKLKTGKKYGDTLVGRAERIRSMGAKTAKKMPPEMLP